MASPVISARRRLRAGPQAHRSVRDDECELLTLGGERSAGDGAGLRACVELGGTPAVPGDDAAVGAEGLAKRVELLRGRGRDVPGQGEALADDEVAGGPDVEAAELEQQEHFGRPAADARSE